MIGYTEIVPELSCQASPNFRVRPGPTRFSRPYLSLRSCLPMTLMRIATSSSGNAVQLFSRSRLCVAIIGQAQSEFVYRPL